MEGPTAGELEVLLPRLRDGQAAHDVISAVEAELAKVHIGAWYPRDFLGPITAIVEAKNRPYPPVARFDRGEQVWAAYLRTVARELAAVEGLRAMLDYKQENSQVVQLREIQFWLQQSHDVGDEQVLRAARGG